MNVSSQPVSSRRPAPILSPETVVIVVILLVAVASLAVLSRFFDARLAFAALDLSPAVQSDGRLVSDIGLSGYMFALSGLTALGALGLRTMLAYPRLDTALTTLTERALYIFATLAVSGIVVQAIKHLVGRARPRYIRIYGAYHFDLLSMKNSLASFPSGHSATAFAMAVALGCFLPRLRMPLILLALAIALSRIVVQAHFASDIVAGGALGIAAALLVARGFAGWNVAFVRDLGPPRVKAPGAILAAIRARGAVS